MQRLKQWAPCYRASTTVNTNIALESFHRVLKVSYLQKKQNRRINYLLHILLKISQDKVFDRLQKSQKGKISHRVYESNKHHRTAQSMNPANCIISRNETSWRIKPESSTQQETVEKLLVIHAHAKYVAINVIFVYPFALQSNNCTFRVAMVMNS